jgi:hypothetical protein
MFIRYLITASIVVSTALCFAQDQNAQNHAVQTDTLKSENVNVLAVPLAFYSPETNVAVGGGVQLFFKTKGSTSEILNSSMFASLIYTLNKQLMFEVSPQIYLDDDNYFLDAKFRYMIFPNLFWGIGPETLSESEEKYNQTEISLSVDFLKSLPSHVNFGFSFDYAHYDVTEVEEGGIMDSGFISGSSGTNVVGLGVVLNLDTRDNVFAPLGGSYYQFKTNFATRVMGSSQTFNTYYLDLRKYINIANNHVLAVQLYSRLTFGDAPFQALAYYGGGDVARGYYKGRYIDKHLYVVQAEYRLPVGKRWELAGFVLTGNVGHDEPEMGLFDDFKSSFGFGPRYFIYKDKRTLLRLDIGINNEGNSGIYFGVNEAF